MCFDSRLGLGGGGAYGRKVALWGIVLGTSSLSLPLGWSGRKSSDTTRLSVSAADCLRLKAAMARLSGGREAHTLGMRQFWMSDSQTWRAVRSSISNL